MKTLYEIKPSEAISYAVERVMEDHPELDKKAATILVKNSLVYNVVIDEIARHVDWLLED